MTGGCAHAPWHQWTQSLPEASNPKCHAPAARADGRKIRRVGTTCQCQRQREAGEGAASYIRRGGIKSRRTCCAAALRTPPLLRGPTTHDTGGFHRSRLKAVNEGVRYRIAPVARLQRPAHRSTPSAVTGRKQAEHVGASRIHVRSIRPSVRPHLASRSAAHCRSTCRNCFTELSTLRLPACAKRAG